MDFVKKEFIIPSIIIVALIIFFGSYFFVWGGKTDKGLVAEEKKIKKDLAVAEEKLSIETATLDELRDSLKKALPIAVVIKNEYFSMANAVKKTDAFFDNPNSSNPKIKIKSGDPLIDASINKKRAEMNKILAEWNSASAGEINQNLIDKMKKDVMLAEDFFSELSQITGSLTEKNSGLSESEINEFQSVIVPVSEEITNIVNSLEMVEVALQQPTPSPAQIQTIQEQITRQENVVAEARAQVIILEEKLSQIQTAIEQTRTPPVSIATTTPVPQIPTFQDNQYYYPYLYTSIQNNSGFQDIITRPEIPQLIQDANEN